MQVEDIQCLNMKTVAVGHSASQQRDLELSETSLDQELITIFPSLEKETDT